MSKKVSYLVGRLGEDSLLPEVRGEVTVGLGNGGVGCLGCWKAIREKFDRRRVVSIDSFKIEMISGVNGGNQGDHSPML